jgi:hypothetical protein
MYFPIEKNWTSPIITDITETTITKIIIAFCSPDVGGFEA